MNALLACLGIIVLPGLAVSGGVVSIIAAREAEWMLRRSQGYRPRLRKPGILLRFPVNGGHSAAQTLRPTRPVA